jgi:hypothetical protein
MTCPIFGHVLQIPQTWIISSPTFFLRLLQYTLCHPPHPKFVRIGVDRSGPTHARTGTAHEQRLHAGRRRVSVRGLLTARVVLSADPRVQPVLRVHHGPLDISRPANPFGASCE